MGPERYGGPLSGPAQKREGSTLCFSLSLLSPHPTGGTSDDTVPRTTAAHEDGLRAGGDQHTANSPGWEAVPESPFPQDSGTITEPLPRLSEGVVSAMGATAPAQITCPHVSQDQGRKGRKIESKTLP